MKTLITLAFVLVLNLVLISAQEGEGGGYGDYGGGGGYGKGGYGGGYEEKKIIKPGVVKPPHIPYFKPVVTYSKFPNYGDYYGDGKLIPIDKIHDYQPKFDLTKFIKPYEHAHLLQKYGKPEGIVKYAPPVYINQPPIQKTIFQHVYVKQPHIVHKVPIIHKSTQVVVKKKPPQIEFDKEVPVDIKDFGKTAVVKPKIPFKPEEPKEPVYEKPKVEAGYGGGGGEEGYGGNRGAEVKPEYQ